MPDHRRVSRDILDRLMGSPAFAIQQNTVSVRMNPPSASEGAARSPATGAPDRHDISPITVVSTNINPDDVESITVLKDAAAASIWELFRGMGLS